MTIYFITKVKCTDLTWANLTRKTSQACISNMCT
ncbi:unnamed protein product [Schistosoma curassoni]|uniref:Uncharacterized protein n=1 Tax=Schistosoma curassoni TaxID=6186 RepID=A0A183JC63_9TREM|nr:unnamed protein product [Schistosoma curassoni]